MDQYNFFKQLLYIIFLKKPVPFSNLKNVRMECERDVLGTEIKW